jgi:hypothetical protein
MQLARDAIGSMTVLMQPLRFERHAVIRAKLRSSRAGG